jgi:hypothetical protein
MLIGSVRRRGGVALLDAILADVRYELAGRAQSDDPTLLTASVLGDRSIRSVLRPDRTARIS